MLRPVISRRLTTEALYSTTSTKKKGELTRIYYILIELISAQAFVCVCAHACLRKCVICMEVWVQLYILGIKLKSSGLYSKYFYPLSHLANPTIKHMCRDRKHTQREGGRLSRVYLFGIITSCPLTSLHIFIRNV